MNHEPVDVLVVGGGIIGLSVAYYTSRAGLSVRVLERGELGQEATGASAGIIAAGRVRGAKGAYGQLLGHGSEMFGPLSAELRELTGLDNGYRRCGGFKVALEEQQVHSLRSARGHFTKNQGVVWDERTPEETRALEPALTGPFLVAFDIPEMSRVCPPRHVNVLAVACQRHGVEIVTETEVVDFERDGEAIRGVKTAAGIHSAGTTVLAAGAWSGGLLEHMGVTLPIKPKFLAAIGRKRLVGQRFRSFLIHYVVM